MNAGERLDLGLEVLCALPRRRPLSCEEIACICDCSARTIHRIENRAMAKLRHPNVIKQLEIINERE